MTRRLTLACALAVAAALQGPERATAISGLATAGPAVGAQYPDAEAQLPDQRRDVLAPRPAPTLVALGAGRVAPAGGDRGAAAVADEPAGLVARAVGAVEAGAGGGARQYGAVPVLLAGVAVLAAASLIRLRRGAAA